MKSRFLLVVAASVCLAACSSFPSEQLSLDLTKETIPVMLNTVKTKDAVRTLSYTAGYSSSTNTFSNSRLSVTVTDSQNNNNPLGKQLQNTLIQAPNYLLISNLDLTTSRINSIFGFDRTNYTINMDADLPAKKE